MPVLSRRTVAALAVSLGLLGVLSFAVQSHAAADDSNVVQALRAGGSIIVVRHGATFPDQADTDPLNSDNIAAQQNLNDKGKALAMAEPKKRSLSDKATHRMKSPRSVPAPLRQWPPNNPTFREYEELKRQGWYKEDKA